MLINWFTVIAQVINFLVLVWLLRRFLYGPILRTIDAREAAVAARLAEAEAKRTEAQAERDDFRRRGEAFEQQRVALLREATEEAGAERERLLGAARKGADALRSQWQDALRDEQNEFGEEIVRRTRQGVFDIARRVLAELATVDLEECMSSVFIARLRRLSVADNDHLAVSPGMSPRPALVRSAFDLPPTQRAAIEAAVRETFGGQTALRFETVPSLVSGIELTSGGQKLAWSISDALASLERNVGELVAEKTRALKEEGGVAEEGAKPETKTRTQAALVSGTGPAPKDPVVSQ